MIPFCTERRTIPFTTIVVWVALFVGSGVSQNDSKAAAFDVSMKITLASYTAPRGIKRTNTVVFSARCLVADDKWLIESHSTKNAIYYAYYDGTNVMQTAVFTREDDLATRTNVSFKGFVNGNTPGLPSVMSVLPEAHPHSHIGVNLPWLAYCSAKFLQKSGRLLPVTRQSVRHDPFAFGYLDKTTCFTDQFRLPKRIDLFVSQDLMQRSPRRESFIRGKKTAEYRSALFNSDPPYEDGVLASTYSVEGWTNFTETTIPTHFRLIDYNAAKNGDKAMTMEASGLLTSLGPLESSLALPMSNPTNVWINDLRFRSEDKLVNLIRYATTNGIVFPSTNARLKSIFLEAERRAPRDPAKTRPFKIIAFTLILFGLPLAYLLTLIRKRKLSDK